MKIKTIYFAGIAAVCLLAFIGCNSTINEENAYTDFNGEYRLIGFRLDDEWVPKENKYDDIISFNGTNHANGKFIAFRDQGLSSETPTEYEFDLSNGKVRFRYLYPYPYEILLEMDNEWEWADFNFNNDILDMKFAPNNVFYWVYKKM
jgi:hypothetical protein